MAQRRAGQTDKPNVKSTAAELDAEIGEGVTPFVYRSKTGKEVIFPDVFDMEWEEAEAFMAKLATLGSSKEALLQMVGRDGYEIIKEDRLSLRQMLTLTQRVQNHYAGSLGSPGEPEPSGNSSPATGLRSVQTS